MTDPEKSVVTIQEDPFEIIGGDNLTEIVIKR